MQTNYIPSYRTLLCIYKKAIGIQPDVYCAHLINEVSFCLMWKMFMLSKLTGDLFIEQYNYFIA